MFLRAKVNHKLVPLSHRLRSGDQVEILTSEKQTPQHEWLDFVITGRAKSRIKSSLKEERRYYINQGQEKFLQIIKDLDFTLDYASFKELRDKFDVSSKEEFYLKVGDETITADDIDKNLSTKKRSGWSKYWPLQFLSGSKSKDNSDTKETKRENGKVLVIEEGESEQNYRLAKCCKPISGDDVVGFINANDTIVIHKKDCPDAIDLMATFGDKIVPVEWKVDKVRSFLAKIYLEGIDETGALFHIVKIISNESKVNMKSLHFDSKDGIFIGNIDLFVHNVNDLKMLMTQLKKIKGVQKVVRT